MKRLFKAVAVAFFVLIVLSGTGVAGINDGLIAFYPFDGNADDASGNGHHGVVNGATLANDRNGRMNRAYSFDGMDDMIVVQENGDFNVGSALTVSLWIRFLSDPPCSRPTSFVSKSAVDPVGSNTGYIFPYIAFSRCEAFGLIVNTVGPYSWDFRRSFSYSSITDPFSWHFYAATYDGYARRVYIDGLLVSVDYQSGVILPNSNNLVFGNQFGTGEWAHAEMDDIRIYNRALTANEIQELFDESVCLSPPSGMVGWWPGDGNANDIVGGNNGSVIGQIAYAGGMAGQAFLLDGVNGYINLGNAPELHVSKGDFTVDAWVKFDALRHPPGDNRGRPAGDMTIVDKIAFTVGDNSDGWRLLKQDDNRFWFCFGGYYNRCWDPAYTVFSATRAVTGVWYHVTAVKHSDSFSIYVNGKLEDTRSPLPPFLDTNLADLLIGGNVHYGSILNGQIDEVEIFNRALSAQEIQAIYAAGSAGKCKNRPPTANAGPDQTIEQSSCAGAAVILDGSGSSDPDNDPLTYTWTENGSVIATGVNPTVTLSYGSHTITLTVDDGKGETASDDVVINIGDTTAPALNVSLNPNVLWPPNHKMVSVSPTVTFSDACNETTTVTLISRTSNEPDNGLGDGDTANDIKINDDGTISLRAERSGKGSGRVYTITYQATDAAGNTTTASATVTVPHNK